MIEQIIALSIYIFLIGGIVIKNNPKIFSRGVKITFSNVVILAFILYTFFPVIDCFVNNKNIENATNFLWQSIFIIICIFMGMILEMKIRIIGFKRKEVDTYICNNPMLWTAFWGIICLLFLFINIHFTRGGLINYLTASYRESYIGNAIATSTIGSLMFAVMPYVMIFTDREVVKMRSARIMAYIVGIIYILVTFMGGNRNLAVMIIIAGAWTVLREKKFNVVIIIISATLGVIILGVMAVLREYGIANVLSGQIKLNWDSIFQYAFSFSNGELGTTLMFEGYTKRLDPSFKFPYSYGYSYIILPILNLIPSAIWASKPMAYADYFSHYAFGNFEGIGYGFSPIYEAKINFGFIWWIVFITIGIFMAKRDKYSKYKNSYYNTGLIACIILNFFRIDFSTCFKFWAMMWCFKWLYLKTLQSKIEGSKDENKKRYNFKEGNNQRGYIY